MCHFLNITMKKNWSDNSFLFNHILSVCVTCILSALGYNFFILECAEYALLAHTNKFIFLPSSTTLKWYL